MNVQLSDITPMPKHQTKPSTAEFVGEVSDLAAGAAILLFALAPFALPALALTALASVALLIPAVICAAVMAAILLARRLWRTGVEFVGQARRWRRTGDRDRQRTELEAPGPAVAVVRASWRGRSAT